MTAQDGFAIGVDLGTSNTVAVVRWPDGRTRPLLFDGLPVLPSAVCLDEPGALHVGRDALRMAALDPARLEPNPKRRIDEESVLLGTTAVATADLLAAVLATVARAAVEAIGFLPPAALTHPAAWGPARRQVLLDAASRAGWPPVRLVPEPVAAARYFADVLRRPVPVGASIAVFDFGGGTVDIAVVRNAGTSFEVLGDGGVRDLGGLDIDAALVGHLGSLVDQGAPQVWQPLSSPTTTSALRQRRLFWDDVRGAKEMLSRTTVAPVAVPGLDRAMHLTREELDRVAGPLVQRAVQEAGAVITRCGLRPAELAGLFLVGGSSRLPIVARLLHAQLGVPPIVLEQPELPVAEGALAELVPLTPMAAAPVSAPPVGGTQPATAAMFPAAQASAVPAQLASTPVSSGAPHSGAWDPTGPFASPPSFGAPATAEFTGAQPVAGPLRYTPLPAQLVRKPWYRRPVTWIGAGAAVLVLVLVAAFAYLGYDPYHEVKFVGLTQLKRVPMGTDSPSTTFTAVSGDRAFLAYQVDSALDVIGYDLASQKQTWQTKIDLVGDTSVEWEGFVALPDRILAFANETGGANDHSVQVLDDHGNRAWSRGLGNEDSLLITKTTIVLDDESHHDLIGLDPHSGKQVWHQPAPVDSYQSPLSDAVFGAVASGDPTGPETMTGADALPGADERVFQLFSDKSARVIDASSGKVVAKQGNIGGTSARALAYGGRLYVADDLSGYQLVSFDLASLGDRRLVYAAPSQDDELKAMAGCGTHICLLDQPPSSDGKKMTLVAAYPKGGTPAWTQDVSGASQLHSLGAGVMVEGDSSTRFTSIFGDDGRAVLDDLGRDQTGVRVNGDSVILFSDDPSSYPSDESLTGFGVHSKSHVPLGELKQVRAGACSWNTKIIVCPSRSDFGIWRFAS